MCQFIRRIGYCLFLGVMHVTNSITEKGQQNDLLPHRKDGRLINITQL